MLKYDKELNVYFSLKKNHTLNKFHISVDTAETQSCGTSRYILPSSTSSGYLANYVTIETRKGMLAHEHKLAH